MTAIEQARPEYLSVTDTEGYCVACAESEAAERKHQQRAASCHCDEHQARRAAS